MEVIRKNLDFEIKQVGDPEERVLEFVGSTADVDRYGDIIEVAGWDYRNYMAKGHGPFLWAHNYDAPPVGKTIEVSKEEKGLVFRVYFPTPEEYGEGFPKHIPSPDTVYRLYLGGFLKATSVGFRDLEREPLSDKDGKQTGWRFKSQELYELSAVPVPANPQALVLAVQKGVVSPEEAEQVKGLVTREAGQTEGEAAPTKGEGDQAKGEEVPTCSEYDRRRLGTGLDPQRGGPPGRAHRLEQKVADFLAQAREGRELMTLAQELLKSALGLMKGDKAPLDSYYSLALHPGYEPPGGQPAREALQQISQKIGELASLAGLAGK